MFDWHKRFRDGRDSVQDEKRSGRPSSATETTVKNVSDVVTSDRDEVSMRSVKLWALVMGLRLTLSVKISI